MLVRPCFPLCRYPGIVTDNDGGAPGFNRLEFAGSDRVLCTLFGIHACNPNPIMGQLQYRRRNKNGRNEIRRNSRISGAYQIRETVERGYGAGKSL
jgi:hypothetical protein